LATLERNTFTKFYAALGQGYLPLSPQVVNSEEIVKWAYNVALTRFEEVWEPRRAKKIAPLADMVCRPFVYIKSFLILSF